MFCHDNISSLQTTGQTGKRLWWFGHQLITRHDQTSKHGTDAEDAPLSDPPAEILIEYKIRPAHQLDGPEVTGLEAIDAGGNHSSPQIPLSSSS